MRLLTMGRVTAAALSLTTFVFLFVHDSWRWNNLFLVPDLILCTVLLIGALLPDRAAAVALPVGLAYAAGVLTASVFSYVVRGEFGFPSLFGVLVSVVTAVLLVQGAGGRRTPDHAPTMA